MADAPRRADAVWHGPLGQGSGEVSLVTSGAAGPLPVTWASRTERSNGKTSPEELVAAAHAACYSMALSHALGEAGTPPEKLETSVTVTFQEIEGGWKTGSSRITVRGWVQGIDEAAFKEAAEGAKDGCPISGALKGNVELSVEATLA
jgi:osmotically inducible protein OsmC